MKKRFRRPGGGDQTGGRRKIRRADVKILLIVTLAAAILLGGAAWLVHSWEDARYKTDVQMQATGGEDSRRKTVVDGVTYIAKENIDTYLFLGIDQAGTVRPNAGYIGGGQSDVQMVLVIDHDAKTWQLLQLNRDSMVQVPVLGVTGSVVGSEFEQLCLAHTYGDGMHKSCINNVNTVSALLWDQPVDGYLSLNIDAVAILNDALGGVPVTITSDFSAVDSSLPMGQTVRLTGEQAETFIRTRKDVDDETNITRMARQRQYLGALFDMLPQMDDETVAEAYQKVQDYTVTNIGSQTIADMAKYLRDYEQRDVLTIDGQSRVEDGFVAYYLDESSLARAVLTLFYHQL